MKILLVNRYHYPVGGTETYLFALDRMLREAGHQVRHFSAADPRNLPCGEAEFFARPLDFKSARSTRRGCSGTGRPPESSTPCSRGSARTSRT
ncbi:MAG: hypothetical protein ACLVL7_08865 [Anaerotruncus massiliensis (ex Togo et al. 2019)]